ncbi:putative phage abortive infection protein [Flavobacterium limnophilum]|uniref:putative phage abortive infection protein n=1 Tax=Flavobacterium limnophilum TaxID=3003262 RepID=UPI0024824497|nr:putative phage abortive infection protein [Flavobacterium limnophilum]
MIKYLKKNRFESIGIIIFLIVLYFSYNYFNGIFNSLYNNSKTTECHEIYGYFGSYVGGVLGTIIGFVTLFFVYITYTSQRKELKLQRELIAQQQFESTFFNMLNVHRELKNDLKLKWDEACFFPNIFNQDKEYSGVEVFEKTKDDFRELTKWIKDNNRDISKIQSVKVKTKIESYEDSNSEYINELNQNDKNKSSNEDFVEEFLNTNIVINNHKIEIKRIRFAFELLFENYQNLISHYCRNVYHILKYIRENEKNKTLGEDFNKYKSYANIFESQLNVDEQFILFYNFICFNDETKGIYSTINLVNHYQFLENLGSNNLLDKELHNNKNFYTFDIK